MVTITEENIAQAGEDSGRGWPANPTLFPLRRPSDIFRDPIFFTGNFLPSEPNHGWVHGGASDPLTAALHVAGARCVELRDFRTRVELHVYKCPLVDRDFTV